MNILLNIGIYMLASSLIMVGYVWFKYITHPQVEYEQISDMNDFTNQSVPKEENIAA